MTITEADLAFLRQAIAIAQQARDHGNHPFGALLVDADGTVLLTAENTVITERDCTGHAETNLVRLASQTYAADLLKQCTLYTSTEPCAMCAGAIYWSNIRRIVFAMSEASLLRLTSGNATHPTLSLSSREVLARGQYPVEVLGPALEEEAIRPHQGFWQ